MVCILLYNFKLIRLLFIKKNLKKVYVYIYRISEEEYVKAIKEEIFKVVQLQEELDIDVLVHGEPEVYLINTI